MHGQYLVLDKGQRLGTSKTAFTERFYYKEGPYRLKAFDDTEETIKHLVGDITLQMSAEDYNPLPDLITNDLLIDLPPDIRDKYEMLEKEFFFMLDSGQGVEVFNKAALTNKCLQFANGAVYPVPGLPLWEEVHRLKLDALEDILEEAAGQQVLCSYAYRSDAERIMTHFKKLNPINLVACKSDKDLNTAMARWAGGDCPLMIGHPASMGHGIDRLQEAGHLLAWYGLTWSLDLFDQFNARLRRQGQGAPVICNRILVRDTLDLVQKEALKIKAEDQTSLRKVMHEYRLSKS